MSLELIFKSNSIKLYNGGGRVKEKAFMSGLHLLPVLQRIPLFVVPLVLTSQGEER
jgi:hypothetical protein